jgi:probable F420-dependent oxidoreductase
MELGIGAGHAEPEYVGLGLPFDEPGTRVARLEESVQIMRALFDGEPVTFHGSHYAVAEQRLTPARRPSLLVGGNGDRVLALGGRLADTVGFTGLGRTRADGQLHDQEWALSDIDRKVAIVRNAAAGRVQDVEFNVLVQHIEVTPNRREVIERIATAVRGNVEHMLTAPFLLVGTVDEIREQLFAARQRWNFTYFVTRSAEQTRQIIEAIR